MVVMNKITGQVPANENLDTWNITVAAVFHPVLFDTQDVASPCDSSPCSHLCVPSNNNHGYKCLCPVDMVLDTDVKCTKKSCGVWAKWNL